MDNIEILLRKIWPTKKYYLQNLEFAKNNKILEAQNFSYKNDIEKLRSEFELCDQENKEFIKNINRLQSENKDLSQYSNNLQEENISLKKSLSELQKKIDNYAYRIKQLETELGVLESQKQSINSKQFWEEHYKEGKNSGTGSYNELAKFKAKVVNSFVSEQNIKDVIELGCGDGNQLSYMQYPNYVGTAVSKTIIEKNIEKFSEDKTKKFYCSSERELYAKVKYDLSISMDVIFHLLEDEVYLAYMNDLFMLSDRYVIIYSSNHEEYTRWPEYRHRNFMRYVQEVQADNWKLVKFIPNEYPYLMGQESTTSAADFYIFKKG